MSREIENNFEERKKDGDLTGLLDDVIRRYIYQLTNDELNEINLEKASGMQMKRLKMESNSLWLLCSNAVKHGVLKVN